MIIRSHIENNEGNKLDAFILEINGKSLKSFCPVFLKPIRPIDITEKDSKRRLYSVNEIGFAVLDVAAIVVDEDLVVLVTSQFAKTSEKRDNKQSHYSNFDSSINMFHHFL